MMRLSVLLALAATLGSTTVLADESALRGQLAGQDGWVGYKVPIAAAAGSPCCYSGDIDGAMRKARCDLDTGEGGFVSGDSTAEASSQMSVYWHVSQGRADQVRAFSADCPVTSRQPVRWIDTVDPGDSIKAIAGWIDGNGDRHHDDTPALAAIAMHADEEATRTLIGLAGAAGDMERRKDAIFWLGHLRGSQGADFVEKVARADPSPDLREHAVFSLSQSKEKDAYPRVRAIAQRDASGDVRGKALFWMAQMHDPRAKADILAALNGEKDDDVREQAVFALSQLGDDAATAALIAVVRGDYPRPVKEKALFWLGQAGTDEALAFLDQILAK
jgi:hypothetical protein